MLLESCAGWQVVGEAAGGHVALTLAEQLRPDVAVVDLVMPEMNGLELTRQLLQTVPEIAVLILTVDDVEGVIHEAHSAGARGYLSKKSHGAEIIKAIEVLLQGESYFLGVPYANHMPKTTPFLSPREREVVQLLAEGRTSKEVATALDISPRTVETHRANVMMKLEIKSLAELVRYAIRYGLAHP